VDFKQLPFRAEAGDCGSAVSVLHRVVFANDVAHPQQHHAGVLGLFASLQFEAVDGVDEALALDVAAVVLVLGLRQELPEVEAQLFLVAVGQFLLEFELALSDDEDPVGGVALPEDDLPPLERPGFEHEGELGQRSLRPPGKERDLAQEMDSFSLHLLLDLPQDFVVRLLVNDCEVALAQALHSGCSRFLVQKGQFPERLPRLQDRDLLHLWAVLLLDLLEPGVAALRPVSGGVGGPAAQPVELRLLGESVPVVPVLRWFGKAPFAESD